MDHILASLLDGLLPVIATLFSYGLLKVTQYIQQKTKLEFVSTFTTLLQKAAEEAVDELEQTLVKKIKASKTIVGADAVNPKLTDFESKKVLAMAKSAVLSRLGQSLINKAEKEIGKVHYAIEGAVESAVSRSKSTW